MTRDELIKLLAMAVDAGIAAAALDTAEDFGPDALAKVFWGLCGKDIFSTPGARGELLPALHAAFTTASRMVG